MSGGAACPDWAHLSSVIGHDFRDRDLLPLAMTHRSYGTPHNERLEFLGDAALGAAISVELYRRFPEHSEGELTRMRAQLVARAALLETAHRWGIARQIRVSRGERGACGVLRADSVVANAVEAVLGAVLLDGGFPAVERVVLGAWGDRLEAIGAQPVIDAKSALQEWTQQAGGGLPDYRCEDRGVERRPRFVAQCLVAGAVLGEGQGARKKEAEQQAAAQALAALRERRE